MLQKIKALIEQAKYAEAITLIDSLLNKPAFSPLSQLNGIKFKAKEPAPEITEIEKEATRLLATPEDITTETDKATIALLQKKAGIKPDERKKVTKTVIDELKTQLKGIE